MSDDDAKPDFIIPLKKVGGDPTSLNETNPVGTNYLSETVYHKTAPLNESLLSRLERQKHKYWHFKFMNDDDLNDFKKQIIAIDPTLTVEHNYGGQRHADIVIRKNGNIVGKLHFLHVNRPDICEPKKFYVKVHYYYFTDKELMSKIKTAVHEFFNKMESPRSPQPPISLETQQGGKRRTLRHTRRHKRHHPQRHTRRHPQHYQQRHNRRHKN